MNGIIYVALILGFFYFLTKDTKKKRIAQIDYLNLKFGAKNWSKLPDDELAKVYAFFRSSELGLKENETLKNEVNEILKKYNIVL